MIANADKQADEAHGKSRYPMVGPASSLMRNTPLASDRCAQSIQQAATLEINARQES